jgi:ABC-type nickel/cobalt efflux system permease component RcnA
MMPRRAVSVSPWLVQPRVAACLVLAVALLVLIVLPPKQAEAHPLGNFTINHYSELEFSEGEARVDYVLDLAEIPTVQEKSRLDTDGDGELSGKEAEAYLDAELLDLVEGLHLEVGGEALPLEVLERSAAYRPGQGGLPTLRIEARLVAELPEDWEEEGAGYYTDRNHEERVGWREIVVRGGPGVAVESSTAPATGVSDKLRSYPQDSLSSPLDHREADFTLVPGDGAAADAADDTAGKASEDVTTSPNGGAMTDRVASLVSVDSLSPTVIGISLLGALFWGSAHALTPGHGKAVVAAYLVGARGTVRHAGLLGLTVTLTHTLGVFALGAVTLYLSRYILPEVLYPWLSVVSGLLVVAIGLALLYRRLPGISGTGGKEAHHADADGAHEHSHAHIHPEYEHSHSDHGHSHSHGSHGDHAHSHLPPGADGSKVSMRSLLALGVTGGLVPCPAALVLLLSAISLGRLEFGMVLVVAFSVGLAIVLTAIGVLMIYARRLFERFSLEVRVPRFLPVASALAISLAGMVIVVGALGQAGFL